MYFGADYYPEHWPEEWWENHAKLMKEANLNVVRLAEFAWAKLEPEEWIYDFDWLDKAIDVLHRQNIKVVMGTPTATPPKWLMDKHPDIYMKDAYGRIRDFGSRRHYCHNNPTYHIKTKEIVAKLAKHYKDHPSIVAWQIDNEFGCHDTTNCYCENCLEAFRVWLKNKYGSIENVNNEWGTIFWSQTYRNWDEVILPAYTVCESMNHRNFAHNPGMLLDYQRFSSDSVVAYQKLQIDEIRKSSAQPITHNFMSNFPDIDYYNLGKDLDFISWDNYIVTPWGNGSYTSISMASDTIRGVKNKNFWVMEQQSGPCGWDTLGDTPKPGQIRLWTYQSVAHGAEGIVYFRWRACTFGTEEYWYGILDHDGVPRRRYREIQQIGKEFMQLSHLFVDSHNITEIALIKSYDNLWSHRFQSHNRKFDYGDLILAYYDAISVNNLCCDVTGIQVDFSKYKVVFMPAFNLMTDQIKEKAQAYVKAGGSLVITFRSGTRNWNNSMTTKTLPGYFKELAGVEVEEFDSLSSERTVKLNGKFGEGKASIWCDILKTTSAEVLATYESDYYKGRAAVTVNNYGQGKVYYVGCDLNQDCINGLIKLIMHNAEVKPVLSECVPGVEVVKKEKDGKQYLMVLNHNNTGAAIKLDINYEELLTGRLVEDMLELEAYGVAVLA